MTQTDVSRFIALILRHKPEAIGITLDEHGWADTEELINGINKAHPGNPPVLDRDILEEIVRTDSKQRYAFSDDHTRIRARQGHSIPVDVELKQAVPPGILYHGTGEKYVPSILREGLIPKTRLYVHLSRDTQTAEDVGMRHGTPVVFQVDAAGMVRDGCTFFLSENGVWLTKRVPLQYLTKL